MTSRIQRQVERLLDGAEEAFARRDWPALREFARDILKLDSASQDAAVFLSAAETGLREAAAATATSGMDGGSASPDEATGDLAHPAPPAHPVPGSFAGGRYTVKRFLGEGGKKRVYLAHDTTLARDVAFALIKTDGLDVEGRERITREAQAMGKLGTHPHVVSVFDMGSEGESPYLVTELMQGGDIEGLLEQAPEHRLAIPDAVSLAIQVCRGLEFAHSHGLVHRDLKPGNVWLTADGTAKIGDFGLAVSLDRSRLTRAGMMVGTVSYMPPEQAMGGEVSPRSDLYSLGAMLYEMVTGRPPFVGEESVAIITQHLNVPPVSPTWHRPECPPGLEALILRLLEKDAAKRPASAAAVLQALEALDRGPSIAESRQAGAFTDTTPAAQANDNPLYRRTFVGREHELRQLQATFDGAVSGNGALVMVVGEPGIGKTALCEQLATYVTVRGGKALVGHCYEEGSLSLPYLPFVEALRSYVLGAAPETLRSELGSGATDVARIVSEVREKVQVDPRSSGDPEDDRWRLYQSLTGFLRNASAVQPLIIVLEDLHWADRGTLDFLVHVARNLVGTRLLLIGTYRDIEVDRAHPLSATLGELHRASRFARVFLRGLTADEVHRMLVNLTGQALPWSVAEAVHRQTEGSPLFIQEVLRYLVEDGQIGRRGERPTGRLSEEIGIPEGLRDVIGKRLSRLTPECNRLLAVAAVIGRDFRLDTLQMVADQPEEAVLAGLEEAVRIGVLEDRSQGGSIRFRFGHAFFRQVLYEELFTPRRLRLHQQVARELERSYAGRLGEHAAELAEHFAQSSDPADLAKALHYGELAAQRASAVYAYGEAVRLLETALQAQEVLDPGDGATRCHFLLALAQALLPAGEVRRAIDEVVEEAYRLAEALGDEAASSHACRIAFAGMSRVFGSEAYGVAGYRAWTERIDRLARPDSVERVYADLALAPLMPDRGAESDLRWTALQTALRVGDPEALFEAAFAPLRNVLMARHHEQRQRALGQVAAFPRDGVSVRTLGRALHALSLAHLSFGQRGPAEECLAELRQLSVRAADPALRRYLMVSECLFAILDGRLEEAVTIADRTARAEGGELSGTTEQFRIGVILYPLIQLGRAADFVNEPGFESTRMAMRTAAWANAGFRAEPQQGLDRLAAELGDAPGGEHLGVWDMVSMLEAALLLDNKELAGALAARLAPVASLAAVSSSCTTVARLLGGAAALNGDRERARGYYEEALRVAGLIRNRPEITLTKLGLAELLLDDTPSAGAAAQEHLDFAIAEFQEMKMRPALERALKHKGLLHA